MPSCAAIECRRGPCWADEHPGPGTRDQGLPLPSREGVGGGGHGPSPPNGPPSMTPWALRLEYDGTPFVGWQRQSTGLSVQEVLESAASKLSHGAPIVSTVAGRT